MRLSRAVPRLLIQSSRPFSSTASAFAARTEMARYVKRITLFKVPPQHIDEVLEAYVKLRASAVKDGKPYILSNESRRVSNTDSPLSEGFTIVSQTVFRNWDDANFYDQKCPAHLELKKTTGRVRTGVQTIIYESEVGVDERSAAKL